MENESFHNALLQLAALSLLREADYTGPALLEQLARRSGGAMAAQDRSLYAVLSRLQQKKWVSCVQGRDGVRYHLEEQGQSALPELLREYGKLSRGLQRLLTQKEELPYG